MRTRMHASPKIGGLTAGLLRRGQGKVTFRLDRFVRTGLFVQSCGQFPTIISEPVGFRKTGKRNVGYIFEVIIGMPVNIAGYDV